MKNLVLSASKTRTIVMTPGALLGVYPLKMKMAFLGYGIFLGYLTSLRKVSFACE